MSSCASIGVDLSSSSSYFDDDLSYKNVEPTEPESCYFGDNDTLSASTFDGEYDESATANSFDNDIDGGGESSSCSSYAKDSINFEFQRYCQKYGKAAVVFDEGNKIMMMTTTTKNNNNNNNNDYNAFPKEVYETQSINTCGVGRAA